MAKKKVLSVGVHDYKPLAYKQGNTWTGLEIDIWEKIAESLDLEFSYVEEAEFSDLLEKTSSSEFDVALAGITRTTERAKELDMSFFTLDTGLGIATKAENAFSLRELAKSLFSKQTKILFIILVGFSIVMAHVYWLIEGGFSVGSAYLPGIYESFWWSIVTFSTVGYGDIYPVTLLGKTFGVVAILSGLAIFGLYIGQLSASLALVKISSKINGPKDLAGKRVAVKAHTTAVAVVKNFGGKVAEFRTVSDMYHAIKEGSVDAVVADMPVLQDSVQEYNLVIAGQAFSRQAYSFVFPKKSKLVTKINKEMMRLREEGHYDEIYDKYLSLQ